MAPVALDDAAAAGDDDDGWVATPEGRDAGAGVVVGEGVRGGSEEGRIVGADDAFSVGAASRVAVTGFAAQAM